MKPIAARTTTRRRSGALSAFVFDSDYLTGDVTLSNMGEFTKGIVKFQKFAWSYWNTGVYFTDSGTSLTGKMSRMLVSDLKTVLKNGRINDALLSKMRSHLLDSTLTKFEYLQTDTKYAKWKKKFFPDSAKNPMMLQGNLADALIVAKANGVQGTVVRFNLRKTSPSYNIFDPETPPRMSRKTGKLASRNPINEAKRVKVSKYASVLEIMTDDALHSLCYLWVLDMFPGIAKAIMGMKKEIEADAESEAEKASKNFPNEAETSLETLEYFDELADTIDYNAESGLNIQSSKSSASMVSDKERRKIKKWLLEEVANGMSKDKARRLAAEYDMPLNFDEDS